MSRPRLPGRATPSGTRARMRRFAAALGASAFARLGNTALSASRLGFGGYRVDDETPAHRAALEQAFRAGVNLVDTSTNYTDGGSERLVGAVLADLSEQGELSREEVVVVSKVGYVQGRNLALAREREAAGRPFPEMVKYMDGCWHCIHPEFLSDQLARSLDRLGLETLDLCLLHNPEYFFSDARHRHLGSLAAIRDEFYRRLREAFQFFEAEVAAGRIGAYGVSSNTCTSPPDDAEATALARMLEAARAAGGPGHHFRALQLPMNLFETGALRDPDGALPTAAREQVAVLVNRPLNAIVGRRMRRLADVPLAPAPAPAEPLAALGALEAAFRRDIAPSIEVERGSDSPDDLFRWAERLDGVAERVENLEHWREIEAQMIVPHVTQALRALDGGLGGELRRRWRQWRQRYLADLERTLAAFRRAAAERSQAESRAVAAALDPALPPHCRGETLSRKTLWVLASTPGVSAVLLGMRRTTYVEDAVEVLRWPPLADVRPAYEAMTGTARAPISGPVTREE
jgi:uncharacterized protein